METEDQAGVLARLVDVFGELVRSTEDALRIGAISPTKWVVNASKDGRAVLEIVERLMKAPAGVPPVGVGMSFGQALQALRQGVRVCRAGWSGKGMWLLLVGEGGSSEYEVFVRTPDGWKDLSPEFRLQLLPWIGMRTAQGGFVPWLASQTDLLANDWQIAVEA